MGKKPPETIPESAKRLRIFLEDHNLKQKDLAKLLYVDEKYISLIACGHRGLSKQFAKKIAKLFPGTRVEWLLGFDDDKTENDQWNRIHKKLQRKDDLVEELIKSNGYSSFKCFLREDTDSEGNITRSLPGVVITSPKGEKRKLTIQQYELLKLNVQKYVKGQLLVLFTEDYFDSMETILRTGEINNG